MVTLQKLSVIQSKALEIDISRYNVQNHNKGLATYFRSETQKFLSKWCKANGYDLYEDGLKIYTTIDSRMQAYAEKAMEKHMKTQQKLFYKNIKWPCPLERQVW